MNTSVLPRLAYFLRHHLWRTLGAGVAGSGTILASIGLLAASGYLITRAADQPPILDLMLLFVAVRFFGISRAALRYLERLLSHDVTFRLLMELRVWFYDRLHPLAPARLIEHRSGDLLARIVGDIETLQEAYLRVFMPLGVALVVGTCTTVWIGFYDPALAAMVAVLLAIHGVALPTITYRLGKKPANAQIQARATLHDHLVEMIQGSEDILAFGQQEKFLGHIDDQNRRLGRLQRTHGRITGLHDTLGRGLTDATVWLTFLMAIPLLHSDTISGPHVALLVLGVMASFEAVQPLGQAFQYLQRSRRAAHRLFDVIDAKPAVDTPRSAENLPSQQGGPNIEFCGVHFRYHGADKPALHTLDLKVEAETRTAIVGPSGAGKSTLLHLLCRFYDPQRGSIEISGQNIRNLSLSEHRSRLVVVSQSTHIFNTSLRNNLRVARPEATEDELLRALDAARLTSVVDDLPKGMNTLVGSHGAALSGGQRRRLAIARAFLKDAPILLLDEPTAHLDPETERQVLAALRKLMPGRTTFVVTHRFVEMERMDHIVVLQKGRITARGTHAELMNAPGLYRRLVEQHRRVLDINV